MSLLIDMLRDAANEVERLEKENARLTAKISDLEAKAAELEAKAHPDNMIDTGRFFARRLTDGSIDEIPYCHVCKAPMDAHYVHPNDDAPSKYACADACGFILKGDTALNILKKTAAEHAAV